MANISPFPAVERPGQSGEPPGMLPGWFCFRRGQREGLTQWRTQCWEKATFLFSSS